MKAKEILSEVAMAQHVRPVPAEWGSTSATGIFRIAGREYAVSTAWGKAEAQEQGANLAKGPSFFIGSAAFGMDGNESIPCFIVRNPKPGNPGWAIAVLGKN